ncbi:MAG TPA: ATP-binding protein, partial [Candidatus Elarobacter sp.]
ARASMTQARASVLSLRADPLEGRPLSAALAALARRLTSETGMRVTLHERGSTSLPYEVEGELFRIASEALANARLHARASRIEVELDGGDAHVALRVRDDGTGFDPAVRDDERYGLRGMEERARLVGGNFRVASRPDTGTLVETIVPRPRA